MISSSKRRIARLSKSTSSSSIGDGSGVSIGYAVMDSDGRFGSQDSVRDVVVRKERYLFYFFGGVGDGAEECDEGKNNEDCDN